MKKLGRKRQRAAAKAPRWVRDIAAAHFDPKGMAEFRTKRLGTFGAASEVRHIDPQSISSEPNDKGPSSSLAAHEPEASAAPIPHLLLSPPLAADSPTLEPLPASGSQFHAVTP